MADGVSASTASNSCSSKNLLGLAWTTSLKYLPKMTISYVEEFVIRQKSPKSGLIKGYKFFCEGFIHEFQGLSTF
jgi:hypothetical protein